VGGEKERKIWLTSEICYCAYYNVGGRYMHTDLGLLDAHFCVKLI
jgi:hypothetical protein